MLLMVYPLIVSSLYATLSVLGPCVFYFYINYTAKSTVHIFTNDMMMYLTVKSKEYAAEFQRDLDKLVGKDLTGGIQSGKVISITVKRNPIKYSYTLHGKPLKHVDIVKYWA